VPQEISVSYRAIKNRVYRLIDALVVGEKTGAEVQESIRRWWNLIHPADRPIAQKYLLIVLGRSMSALDAIGNSLTSSTGCEDTYGPLLPERMKVMERSVREAGARWEVSRAGRLESSSRTRTPTSKEQITDIVDRQLRTGNHSPITEPCCRGL
jgi:hypothetical protein